jgi:hypothetical protein
MQKIKAVRLKYDFMVGKIIRRARSVVIKLSNNIHTGRFMKKSLF